MQYQIASQAHYPVGQNIESAIKTIEEVAKVIAFNNLLPTDHYINIFCRGSSGAILASLLISKIAHPNISIVCIRKPHENSHSSAYIPYPSKPTINVVIDDFIGTGETLNAIWEGMNNMDVHLIDLLIIGCAEQLDEWIYPTKPIVNHIISDQI